MTTRENRPMLGIDTGGTYTDAVVFSHARGVMAKAKSLTTRHDLSIGIAGAMRGALNAFAGNPSEIALVSLSTTLATNALVERQGGSVGLIMVGFDEGDLERQGLARALGNDPVVFLPGGHDVQGNERPLDPSGLDVFLETRGDKVESFAVAGYFAVRNPAHEIRVREFLREKTGRAVTCSHELSSKLGGPKRALTTLLNARLVPVIQKLIQACRKEIASASIHAPLMVVRGDGTLVSDEFALERPIETILSGPAASLMGAQFLLGESDAVVSDIGGTTTDVAILEKGWPRINPDGACVGGHTTMVEAVAMHTFGLGGDSEVSLSDENSNRVQLGPRRQVPVSFLATDYPEIIGGEFERLSGMEAISAQHGRFAWKLANDEDALPELKTTEAKLLAKLSDRPQALDKLLKGSSEAGTLNRLVARGLARVSGFTPSDAMHVLGLQDNWDGQAALAAAEIFARQKDRFGNRIAESVEKLCQQIKDQLTRQSADVILKTCMDENGMTIGPGAKALMDRALDATNGFVKFSLKLDRALVGLGASAPVYYPAIGERLNTPCKIPEHADVANAIGAVAAKVRVSQTIMVTSPDGGQSVHVQTEDFPKRFVSEEEALAFASKEIEMLIREMAARAGAENPLVELTRQVHAPEIEGRRHFVEAKLTATATGLPRIR